MNASAPAAAGDASSVARSRASKAAGAGAMISALFISASSPPAAAMECHAHKGSDQAYWSWREIAGRRCWYRGHRGLSKTQLQWPANAPARKDPKPIYDEEAELQAAASASVSENIIARRWPYWNEFARTPFVETAAAAAQIVEVPPDPPTTLQQPTSPPPPPLPKTERRSPAVVLAVLAVSLGLIVSGAFLMKMRT